MFRNFHISNKSKCENIRGLYKIVPNNTAKSISFILNYFKTFIKTYLHAQKTEIPEKIYVLFGQSYNLKIPKPKPKSHSQAYVVHVVHRMETRSQREMKEQLENQLENN